MTGSCLLLRHYIKSSDATSGRLIYAKSHEDMHLDHFHQVPLSRLLPLLKTSDRMTIGVPAFKRYNQRYLSLSIRPTLSNTACIPSYRHYRQAPVLSFSFPRRETFDLGFCLLRLIQASITRLLRSSSPCLCNLPAPVVPTSNTTADFRAIALKSSTPLTERV